MKKEEKKFADEMSSKLLEINTVLNKYPSKIDLLHLLFNNEEKSSIPELYSNGISDGSIEKLLGGMDITDYIVYSRIDKLYQYHFIGSYEAEELYANYRSYKAIKSKLEELFIESKKEIVDIRIIESMQNLYGLLGRHLEVLNKYKLLSSFDFGEAINTQIKKEMDRKYYNKPGRKNHK